MRRNCKRVFAAVLAAVSIITSTVPAMALNKPFEVSGHTLTKGKKENRDRNVNAAKDYYHQWKGEGKKTFYTPDKLVSKATAKEGDWGCWWDYTPIITRSGVKVFTGFNQSGPQYWGGQEWNTYTKDGRCSWCAFATVLTGVSAKYKNATPLTVQKAFGAPKKHNMGGADWRKCGIAVGGMAQVFSSLKIPVKLVPDFDSRAQLKKDLKNYLSQGKQIIILITGENAKTKKSGRYGSDGSVHNVALLGLTETGDVIIADSVNRGWAFKKNHYKRFEVDSLENIVQYMRSTDSTKDNKRCRGKKGFFYNDTGAQKWGYIVVG